MAYWEGQREKKFVVQDGISKLCIKSNQKRKEVINMDSILLWLIIMVLCLIVEIISLGLTTIWFAVGALAAMITSVFHGSTALQIIVFIAVSLLMLLITRPIAVKYLNRNTTKTNTEAIIGETVQVVQTIDNIKETGQVKCNHKN